MPPCALMKPAPTPIFISLGSGNKVTDSDIDRWPLLASQMCIIIPLVSALFHSGRQRRASQGMPVGNAAVVGRALIYITIHYLSRRQTGSTLLHHIHPVMHYRCCGFYWDCGMLASALPGILSHYITQSHRPIF